MSPPGREPQHRRADELTVTELHDLLRLRVDVFVVEQVCPYPELDGRDLDPTTGHWWFKDDDRIVAYLRTLEDPDGSVHIGRVVTDPDARGRGLAGALLDAALKRVGRPVHLKAQSHLTGWYAGFGFVADGDAFVEDGIPHTPMILV